MPNSSCNFWKNKSNFASIFSVISHNSSVLSLAQTLYNLVKGERTIFLDFQVLESTFVKFLMSVLKQQVSSSSNCALFFIVMARSSSVNFKFIHFVPWTKGSHQSSNFDTFEHSAENLPNSCHFPSNKLVFLQILHHSSKSWKITPLYFFSSNNIYFAQKEPIKVKIFKTIECSGQNLPILYVNFETTSRFLSEYCIPLQFNER